MKLLCVLVTVLLLSSASAQSANSVADFCRRTGLCKVLEEECLRTCMSKVSRLKYSSEEDDSMLDHSSGKDAIYNTGPIGVESKNLFFGIDSKSEVHEALKRVNDARKMRIRRSPNATPTRKKSYVTLARPLNREAEFVSDVETESPDFVEDFQSTTPRYEDFAAHVTNNAQEVGSTETSNGYEEATEAPQFEYPEYDHVETSENYESSRMKDVALTEDDGPDYNYYNDYDFFPLADGKFRIGKYVYNERCIPEVLPGVHYYPHPRECQKFFQYVPNQHRLVEKLCPEGTEFDINVGVAGGCNHIRSIIQPVCVSDVDCPPPL